MLIVSLFQRDSEFFLDSQPVFQAQRDSRLRQSYSPTCARTKHTPPVTAQTEISSRIASAGGQQASGWRFSLFLEGGLALIVSVL